MSDKFFNKNWPSPFKGRAAHGRLRVNAIAFIPG